MIRLGLTRFVLSGLVPAGLPRRLLTQSTSWTMSGLLASDARSQQQSAGAHFGTSQPAHALAVACLLSPVISMLSSSHLAARSDSVKGVLRNWSSGLRSVLGMLLLRDT